MWLLIENYMERVRCMGTQKGSNSKYLYVEEQKVDRGPCERSQTKGLVKKDKACAGGSNIAREFIADDFEDTDKHREEKTSDIAPQLALCTFPVLRVPPVPDALPSCFPHVRNHDDDDVWTFIVHLPCPRYYFKQVLTFSKSIRQRCVVRTVILPFHQQHRQHVHLSRPHNE